MIDRGELAAGRCRCGICRNQFVRRRPRDRDEGKRWGWRYVDPWGWCCPTCALGAPGVQIQEQKRRMRPKRIHKAPPRPKVDQVQELPQDRTPGRRGYRGGGPVRVTDILREIAGEPEPEE